MRQESTQRDVWQAPAAGNYLLLCLCSLGAVTLVLLQRGYGAWSLAPTFVGVVGLPTRGGPAALLLVLVPCLNVIPHSLARAGFSVIDLPDLILCAGVLGYVAGHARLQGLTAAIFPREPPDPFGGGEGRSVPRARRDPRLVTSRQISGLLVSLPLWSILALVLHAYWPAKYVPLNSDLLRDVVAAVWLIAIPLLAAAIGFRYRSQRSMNIEQAELVLQDTLWRETRGDQQRINRWLVWQRQRNAKDLS